MSKKVFLGIGHGGRDSGATANGLKEKDLTLKIGNYCKSYLEKHGVSVKMSRTKDENDPVTEEVQECNSYNPSLAIDIHINAGGGDGFECFYHYGGGTGKTLAKNIEKYVKKSEQNSRGCKTRKNSSGKDYYAFIRNTKAPAVICELGFIDNKTDLKDFDENSELKKFGEAYAKGILETLGILINETTNTTGYLYHVRVKKPPLNIRKGAGTEYSVTGIIKDTLKYTIIEEKKSKDGGIWGKLKSGAGWINVGYCKKV